MVTKRSMINPYSVKLSKLSSLPIMQCGETPVYGYGDKYMVKVVDEGHSLECDSLKSEFAIYKKETKFINHLAKIYDSYSIDGKRILVQDKVKRLDVSATSILDFINSSKTFYGVTSEEINRFIRYSGLSEDVVMNTENWGLAPDGRLRLFNFGVTTSLLLEFGGLSEIVLESADLQLTI